jgi:hypothetical protein
MLSIEAYFAPKEGLMAVFRAFQAATGQREPLSGAVLSGVCSIFYMTIVKKNEQG